MQTEYIFHRHTMTHVQVRFNIAYDASYVHVSCTPKSFPVQAVSNDAIGLVAQLLLDLGTTCPLITRIEMKIVLLAAFKLSKLNKSTASLKLFDERASMQLYHSITTHECTRWQCFRYIVRDLMRLIRDEECTLYMKDDDARQQFLSIVVALQELYDHAIDEYTAHTLEERTMNAESICSKLKIHHMFLGNKYRRLNLLVDAFFFFAIDSLHAWQQHINKLTTDLNRQRIPVKACKDARAKIHEWNVRYPRTQSALHKLHNLILTEHQIAVFWQNNELAYEPTKRPYTKRKSLTYKCCPEFNLKHTLASYETRYGKVLNFSLEEMRTARSKKKYDCRDDDNIIRYLHSIENHFSASFELTEQWHWSGRALIHPQL